LLTKSRTHQMFFSISINLCKYGYLEHQGKLKASNLSCKYPDLMTKSLSPKRLGCNMTVKDK
jgi:hypothetical protein